MATVLKVGKAAAGAEQDLEAVDLRHPQIGDQKREGLRLQQRHGARGASGDADLRAARQAGEDAPVGIEEFLVVVEDENPARSRRGGGFASPFFRGGRWPASC